MKKENFVVISFSKEAEAIDASHKLQDLAIRGDISLGYNIMLRKNSSGEIEVLKKTGSGDSNSWTGMLVGMLAGLFFGPFGFLISTLAGTAIGAGVDSSYAKFNNDFAELIKEKLSNGNVAIVANIDEQNPVFIDEAMKAYNGTIYRTTYSK